METIKSPRLEGNRRRLTLLLAVSLGLASGCAQIPRLDPPPAMRKVDELGSSNSFAAPVAAWPSDQWWHAYGDPQLDALIERGTEQRARPRPCPGTPQGRRRAGSGCRRHAPARGDGVRRDRRGQAELRLLGSAAGPAKGLERLWRRHPQHVL